MSLFSEAQLVALIGAAPFLALSLIWLIHDSIQIARVIRAERHVARAARNGRRS